MTTPLYLPDIEAGYTTSFEATVTKARPSAVVLDQTLFYATGGGQPFDTGVLRWAGGEAKVTDVSKKGEWKHTLSGEAPAEGTVVQGGLDWARRYAMMRMHTSQHVLSAVVYREYDATTNGNNINRDYSRVDFDVERFTDEQLAFVEAECNAVFKKGVPVKGYEEDRATLESRIDARSTLMHLIPKSITSLRVVEIQDIDTCPCAGTHVRNTSEIGTMRILRTENKGKGRTRLIYELL